MSNSLLNSSLRAVSPVSMKSLSARTDILASSRGILPASSAVSLSPYLAAASSRAGRMSSARAASSICEPCCMSALTLPTLESARTARPSESLTC